MKRLLVTITLLSLVGCGSVGVQDAQFSGTVTTPLGNYTVGPVQASPSPCFCFLPSPSPSVAASPGASPVASVTPTP